MSSIESLMVCNPFTTAYLHKEVEFYGLKEYDQDGIKLTSRSMPVGPLRDYLNKQFRAGGKGTIPILWIPPRRAPWMSLTWMELASNYMPIEQAYGEVVHAGLGMGYTLLRTMEKDEVELVDVYEKDPRIINFFTSNFSHRDGFKKVRFTLGDARELLKGRTYDYAYIDIYPTLLGDEVIDDLYLFNDRNEFDNYHFWGLEAVWLDAAHYHEIVDWRDVPFHIRVFIDKWAHTPFYEDEDAEEDDGTELQNFYEPSAGDEEFVCRAIDAIRSLD